MDLTVLIVIVVIALAFDFTNGFHDAANAIATSVSTRALTPRVALALAAVMNFVGASLGTGVAKTVGSGIIATPASSHGLTVVFAALIGAIGWNLLTWRLGLPSSSSHALIGGLVGAALAASSGVHWHGVTDKVLLPMLISPIVGIVLGYLTHTAILWIFRNARPGRTVRGFRIAQSLSA
ncbi:MAG TPA: anion permease, partial [Actinoallomurus sp.]|nr:anion permease [Actinoallomurus sp.]